MSAPNCPNCGGGLVAVRCPAWMNREQWDATKAGDYYCSTCTDATTRSGCAYFSEADLTRARPSGVEVVRAEMLRVEPYRATDGIESQAERVDAMLARAARLYTIFAATAEDNAKPRPLDWSELSAKRVRAWVAVAREAGRL